MNRRLYRSADDRVLAGVAGGIAETYDFDPGLVRVVWALLIIFTGGAFLILYIIMALVIPLAPDTLASGAGWPTAGAWPASPAPASGAGDDTTAVPPSVARAAEAGMGAAPAAQPMLSERERRRMMRGRRRNGDTAGPVVFGLILVLIGAFFLLRQYVPAIDWGQVWPIGLIALGAVLVLAALARSGSR